MAGNCKYYKQEQYVSYDSGQTWSGTGVYQQGALIESASTDCGYVPPVEPQYRDVSGTPYCSGTSGYDKYVDVYSQVSYDSGSTWTTTATTPTLVEANSEDCGYVPPVPPTPSYENQYLTFRALEDTSFSRDGYSRGTIYYSLNSGSTWNSIDTNTSTPTIHSGETIMWKGNQDGDNTLTTFSSSGRFEVEGNAMSLVYGDNFSGQTTLSDSLALAELFAASYDHLISVENMVLPATTLSPWCYERMFWRCTSITTAPILPATTLAQGCYENMFEDCNSLNSITCLATNISANGCTASWLYGAAASGTFTTPSSTQWSSGSSGIPNGWTRVNI